MVRSLRLWSCFLWRAGWLLTNRGYLRWINYWIIQWRRHMYHRWWQLIALRLTFLSIKSPVIMRSVLWRAGRLLKNLGQMRWVDDWIIQSRRHRYLWVTVLAIKASVIIRTCLLPTMIFPCSTSVATTNTLCTRHDEVNLSLWWCCVPVILFVGVQQKVRAKFLAQKPHSYLSFSIRNKIDYDIFVLI